MRKKLSPDSLINNNLVKSSSLVSNISLVPNLPINIAADISPISANNSSTVYSLPMNTVSNMSPISDMSSHFVNSLNVVTSSFVNNINHIIEVLPFSDKRIYQNRRKPKQSSTSLSNVNNVNNIPDIAGIPSETVIEISNDLLRSPMSLATSTDLSKEDILVILNSDNEAMSLSQGAATPSWASKTLKSIDSNEATTTVNQQETSHSENNSSIVTQSPHNTLSTQIRYIKVLVIWLPPISEPVPTIHIALARNIDGTLSLTCGKMERDDTNTITNAIREVYAQTSITLTESELTSLGMEIHDVSESSGPTQVFLAICHQKHIIQSQWGQLGRWVTAIQYLRLWRQRLGNEGGRDQLRDKMVGASIGQFLFPNLTYKKTSQRVKFGGRYGRPKGQSIILPEYIWGGHLSLLQDLEVSDEWNYTVINEEEEISVIVPETQSLTLQSSIQDMICIVIANTEVISSQAQTIRSVLADIMNRILSNQSSEVTIQDSVNRLYFYDAKDILGYNSYFIAKRATSRARSLRHLIHIITNYVIK